MSENNNSQEGTENGASTPIITFEVFESFYAANSDLDNNEYYKAFPTVNAGTIRSWKSKARANGSEPAPNQQQTPEDKANVWRDELIESLSNQVDNRTKELIKDLDPDSKVLVLKEQIKQLAAHPAPNNPSIPNPTGRPKMGLEKYMKYVPGSDKLEWEIPATVLLDPIKNKKLGEY